MSNKNWYRIGLVLVWLNLLGWGLGDRIPVFSVPLAYAQVNVDCVINVCTGSVPANAAACNANPPAADLTPYSCVASCGATGCTFGCNNFYSCKAATTTCEPNFWLQGGWGVCSNCNETQSVTCRKWDNTVLPDTDCSGAKPPTIRACGGGTVCRAVAGACDVQELCDGVATSCPVNTFLPASTVCRASAGVCDVAENCTGSAAACPADVFRPNATVCRAATDVCDATEMCTGFAAACPADVFRPNATVCRAAGANATCDPAEYCTGSAAACPANGYAGNGTVCDDMDGDCGDTCNTGACSGGTPCGGGCDNDGVCDSGSGEDGSVCPADCCDANTPCGQTYQNGPVNCGAEQLCPTTRWCRSFVPGGYSWVTPATVATYAVSPPCDQTALCAGTAFIDQGPANAYNNAGLWGLSANGCCGNNVLEGTEQCDLGFANNGACPQTCSASCANNGCGVCAGKPNTFVCRAEAVGGCDVEEKCDGVNPDCPVDVFRPDTTVCRAAGADATCDPAEYCSGGSCPGNTYANTSTACASDSNVCTDDYCNGSGTCAHNNNTVQCRAAGANATCDPAENCSGGSCPANSYAVNGTDCDDSNPLTCNDKCNGSGSCNLGGACSSCTGTLPPNGRLWSDDYPVVCPAVVDCVGFWGGCVGSVKTYTITTPAQNGGAPCPNNTGDTETVSCCANDCGSLWCSTDCGNGRPLSYTDVSCDNMEGSTCQHYDFQCPTSCGPNQDCIDECQTTYGGSGYQYDQCVNNNCMPP